MRHPLFYAVVLALVVAQPVLAQYAPARVSDAALTCPKLEVAGDLPGKLIDAMLSGAARTPEGKALFDRFEAAAAQCAEKHSVPASLRGTYAAYAFDLVMRDELALRLRAARVPVEALDEALGYGPGRVNPVIHRVEQSHVDKMTAAARKRGYDLEKAPEEVLRYVGMYVGAQSGLVEDLAALR